MLVKRQVEILRAVKEAGTYSITDLAKQLRVSTETIRRNIKPLIDNGSLVGFHGGVIHPYHLKEPPFQRRMQVNKKAKMKIAALIARIVKDEDTLILDNGTTTAYVAEALADHSSLTVVTNSAEIVRRLPSRRGNRVFITGGEIGGQDAAAFGPSTISFVQQFKVQYAFISASGISSRGDLVDFNLFEAEFARAAMKQARETWVIVDQSKFGRSAPVTVCDLSAVDTIVCDDHPPAQFHEIFARSAVRVLAAGDTR
jgi:DeoR family glycerol-3-phosphate regulon repressor